MARTRTARTSLKAAISSAIALLLLAAVAVGGASMAGATEGLGALTGLLLGT